MSTSPETILFVDDTQDILETMVAYAPRFFPNINILKASSAEIALAILGTTDQVSSPSNVRIICDGLRSEWKTVVAAAKSMEIPPENIIVLSSDNIKSEVEAVGIPFQDKDATAIDESLEAIAKRWRQ